MEWGRETQVTQRSLTAREDKAEARVIASCSLLMPPGQSVGVQQIAPHSLCLLGRQPQTYL